MIYRETGRFSTTYAQDQSIFPIIQDRWFVWLLIAAAIFVVPVIANEYWLQAVMIPFLIFSLAAIGLNLLTGYCGQVSLGTGGFMAVGGTRAAHQLCHLHSNPTTQRHHRRPGFDVTGTPQRSHHRLAPQ